MSAPKWFSNQHQNVDQCTVLDPYLWIRSLLWRVYIVIKTMSIHMIFVARLQDNRYQHTFLLCTLTVKVNIHFKKLSNSPMVVSDCLSFVRKSFLITTNWALRLIKYLFSLLNVTFINFITVMTDLFSKPCWRPPIDLLW